MREIVEELETAVERGTEGALATIVRARGSTYRKEGAKLLCLPGPRLAGAISGGCLESDVWERSLAVAREGRPAIATYDSHAVNENVWGLGLGCDGTVEVLIEPLSWWAGEQGRATLEAVRRRFDDGCSLVMATVLPRDAAATARALFDENGRALVGSGRPELDAALAAASAQPRSGIVRAGGVEAFVDRLAAPSRLVVFGGGPDVAPLVRMARETGFRVTVADPRASRDRFPDAHRTVPCRAEEISSDVLCGDAAFVLMTHAFDADRAILERLLALPRVPAYVGVLGPRARTRALLDDLAKRGVRVSPQALAAIRAPVGLDLGSEAPAEIALAVLAEIVALRNGRSARPLREKAASAAERSPH